MMESERFAQALVQENQHLGVFDVQLETRTEMDSVAEALARMQCKVEADEHRYLLRIEVPQHSL